MAIIFNGVTVAGEGIPSGGIILWSGSTASIPAGWYLCNGANGTPNLQDRFVVGAGSSYAVGGTGGSKDSIVVAHTHTLSGSTSSAGAHTHPSVLYGGSCCSGPSAGASNGADGYNINTGSAGAHTHTLSGTAASTGVSGTNANLPPYYALAYIMKS